MSGLFTKDSTVNNSIFDTSHFKTELKGRSVRGGVYTIIAQWARFFIRMGSTVVLARMLTPQDFGLIAMVTIVTGFLFMFKDMGLSMATVQREEINHNQISTLFWVNLAISLIIMLLTAAVAPVVAWFYVRQQIVGRQQRPGYSIALRKGDEREIGDRVR